MGHRYLILVALVSTIALAISSAEPKSSSDPVPQRIIATAPNNVEIICELGAEKRLVGIGQYTTFPPQVLELPRVGGIRDPDLEKILALKPDLVVLRGRNIHLEQLCDRNSIPLYFDKTDSLPSLFVTIKELGEVLDLESKATQLSQSMNKELERIRKSVPKSNRPTVLLTIRNPDKLSGITTVAQGSFLNSVIEIAGGNNVFSDLEIAYPQVSLEDIIARQPDIIIEAMPGEENTPEFKDKLTKQWKDLGLIKAATSNQVHVLTEDYLLIPSPRVVLLANKLHHIFFQKTSNRGNKQ